MASFENICTCGGYAWAINGRDPANPHMSWCPQLEEYSAWWDATHAEEGEDDEESNTAE
jgi:hypothetical protein